MALPVAQLGNLGSSGLGGGVITRPTKLRDQILAQLAAQIGGQLLSNVVEHATGGDQTPVAQAEGLVPTTDRNIFQRFLGPQLDTAGLERLRTGASTRDVQGAQAGLAKMETKRAGDLLPGEVAQQGLTRGLLKEQTTGEQLKNQAFPQLTQAELDQRAAQTEQARAQTAATQAQTGFIAPLAQSEIDARAAQAEAARSGIPVNAAQARDINAQAVGREGQNKAMDQVAIQQWIQSQLGGLPKELVPGRTKQLQAYTEQDSTPTTAEFQQFLKDRMGSDSSQNPQTVPQTPAPAVGTDVGGITIGPSITDRLASIFTMPKQDPRQEAEGLFSLYEQASGPYHISRQGQAESIAQYQEALKTASPEALAILDQLRTGQIKSNPNPYIEPSGY